MTKAEKRLNEVANHFKNKDVFLSFRRLIDCAIDTQNLDIYKDVIALTDWQSKFPEKTEEFISKSLEVLEKISKFPIKEANTNAPVITGSDLIKSYGNNRFTLGPISIQIRKGDVYGLVGENGNGKTTLLRILAKELKYNQGRLDFNFSKTFKHDFDLRSHLIYIPQRTEKWYGSLKDNLKLVLSSYGIPPEDNEIRVLMMIARFGLWNYKHLKWSELSSGYKMRFELARTLLRQPEVLLLDEPLANLDILAQQVILEDLKSICNSINNPIALILSSQQLYEVEKISDKVIYLKDGQYTDNNTSENTPQDLVIEMECDVDRAVLEHAFKTLNLKALTYNGGVFIATFTQDTSFNKVLEVLATQPIALIYIRNISKSTRRFFIS